MSQIRVAAVVLAAGMSRRMGRPKALLPLDGRAMILRVIEPILATGLIDPVIIVTGHEAENVRTALAGYQVNLVHNADYSKGEMLSSVKAGVTGAQEKSDAFFLVLGDQPLVRMSTYQALLAMANNPEFMGVNPGKNLMVIQPTYKQRRGHPIVLPASAIESILALPAEATLKTLTQQATTIEVSVDDPGILADIDTPEDYHHAVEIFSAQRSASCTT